MKIRSVAGLLATQCCVAALMALIALSMSIPHAVSALVGGMIAILPTAVFVRGFFSSYRADQPAQMLGRIYIAQVYKMVLTGLLFAVAFHWQYPIQAWVLFTSFILVYLLPLPLMRTVRA